MNALKRTERVSHRPKGRKRGSGYRSQLLILLILTNGATSSSEIKQLSGLNKDTVCSNIRILKGIRAVIAERGGRNIIYRLGKRALWKWLFFHAFVGTRWARKALKTIKRLFADLPIMTKPIKEMYSLVRNNAELYEGLKEKSPELKGEDVWKTTWLVEQFRYVNQEKKYKNLSSRGCARAVGKRRWGEKRKVQRKIVGERCPECGGTNLIKDYNTNETVCGTCGVVIREREVEDPWYQHERMGLKRQWRTKWPTMGSYRVPRMKELQLARYLKDRESFSKFCRQLDKGFREQVQKALVGKIKLALYHDFLQTCFPEIMDFAVEHRIKDYERLPFDRAIKFDKLVAQLVKERVDKVEEFCEQLKSEIDYIHDYTIRF